MLSSIRNVDITGGSEIANVGQVQPYAVFTGNVLIQIHGEWPAHWGKECIVEKDEGREVPIQSTSPDPFYLR